jgi:hypothetical protein
VVLGHPNAALVFRLFRFNVLGLSEILVAFEKVLLGMLVEAEVAVTLPAGLAVEQGALNALIALAASFVVVYRFLHVKGVLLKA